jgi:hypothetical protein
VVNLLVILMIIDRRVAPEPGAVAGEAGKAGGHQWLAARTGVLGSREGRVEAGGALWGEFCENKIKMLIGLAPPAGFEAKNFVSVFGALIQSSAPSRPRVHMPLDYQRIGSQMELYG